MNRVGRSAHRTPAPAGPATYGELRRVLQERLPAMSPGQQRVARLLLTDPEGCAFRTIGEMARAANTHESSLVRFASSVGLEGYPALVELCRDQLAEQAQLVRRFEEARLHRADDLLATAVTFDQHNLARTFARIDGADWARAVDLLTEAPAVYVIGLRKCFAVAYLLTYLLHLVRRNVRLLSTTSGLLVDELRDLAEGDVLVGVAIHRYTADTVRAVEFAHAQGVRTIVLTDNPASPLVRHADVVFYVETTGVTILRSLTAFSSLVQALATAVAVRLDTSSRSELLLDEALNEAFNVYVDGADHPESASRRPALHPTPRGTAVRARRSVPSGRRRR